MCSQQQGGRKVVWHCYHHGTSVFPAVYCVSLIQYIGSSIVVTHRTADVRVTLDRPVTLFLVPVEISTGISGSHAATYLVNACVS